MSMTFDHIVHTQDIALYQDGCPTLIEESLASEVRVALIYNGISHTVMMATPRDLEHFAVGFTLSERIVENISEIKSIDIESVENGVLVYIEITQRRFMALKEQQRNMAGRTGCGLCGVAKLEQAIKPVIPVESETVFNIHHLVPALAALRDQQETFKVTGATHAAMGIFSDGEIAGSFEDIGRHIALDKLIGCVSRKGERKPDAVLLTSRASFEMVQKVASAGIPVIFAMSAVTSLARDLAEKSNITLVGFCRNNRATVYTHGRRITANAL